MTLLQPTRLQYRAAFQLFGLSQRFHQQDKSAIPALWRSFASQMGAIPTQIGKVSYGVVYDADQAGAFDYLCAVEVAEFPPSWPSFTRLTVPAQRYAVFEHSGPIATIGETWMAIYQSALATSALQPSFGPAFELYDERYDAGSGLGLVEIWVPVQA